MSFAPDSLIPNIEKKKIIIALNKVDRLSSDDLQKTINLIDDILFAYVYYLISAQKGIGIEELIQGILKQIGLSKTIILSIPHDPKGQELYRWLTQRFVIIDSEWGENITLTMRITEEEEKVIRIRLLDHKEVSFPPVAEDST